MPERYGTWRSICGLIRGWPLASSGAAILTGLYALAAEAGKVDWVVWINFTINRAHQHAAGLRRHSESASFD